MSTFATDLTTESGNTETDANDINTDTSPTILTKKNISKQEIQGKCDLKCVFNFAYEVSEDTVVTNNGTTLSLTYERAKQAPVTFNTFQYYVYMIYIYAPSIHLFNGGTADAEMIIEHMPILGGESLFVCVPIVRSTQVTNASNTLTNIIEKVSTYAANENETTSLNATMGFNLMDFVPSKPFINYTGTEGFVGQVIVFTLMDGIPLSTESLDTLKKIIEPATMDVSGAMLFFNPDGPNTVHSADGIYISCKPTGTSSDETEVTYKNETVNDSDFSWNNPVVHFILMAVMLILLYAFITFVFKAFFSEKEATGSSSTSD
jgi:hypothetical protein